MAAPERLQQSLRHSLHWATYLGGFAKNLELLLQARADVNDRCETQTRQFPLWVMMKYWALQHRIRQSRLTLLAYHHQGATPLMFSLINCQFEATQVLLTARADINLRNSRGVTAADLAREVSAPQTLMGSLG